MEIIEKENVITDCNLAWPLLKENGLMLFDDYERSMT